MNYGCIHPRTGTRREREEDTFNSGMTYHAEVMCKLFNALEFNIKVPLSPDPNDSNVDYVFRVIGGILQQAFGHLSEFANRFLLFI